MSAWIDVNWDECNWTLVIALLKRSMPRIACLWSINRWVNRWHKEATEQTLLNMWYDICGSITCFGCGANLFAIAARNELLDLDEEWLVIGTRQIEFGTSADGLLSHQIPISVIQNGHYAKTVLLQIQRLHDILQVDAVLGQDVAVLWYVVRQLLETACWETNVVTMVTIVTMVIVVRLYTLRGQVPDCHYELFKWWCHRRCGQWSWVSTRVTTIDQSLTQIRLLLVVVQTIGHKRREIQLRLKLAQMCVSTISTYEYEFSSIAFYANTCAMQC